MARTCPTFVTAAAAWLCLSVSPDLYAQQVEASREALAPVPRIMWFSGTFRPADGSRASLETITVSVYRDKEGGTALWQETQRIAVDAEGRYNALIGSTSADGLPLDLFTAGEPRWIGVRFHRSGEVEGARVHFASVPYALKAADADTLGGKPSSAYLLADPQSQDGSQGVSLPAPLTAGTLGHLGMFIDSTNLGDSVLYQSPSGMIGAGTTAPFDVMHVAFNNSVGSLTGYAVQNLSGSATAYSGMLFYDQTGALGQFQGFSNGTHEYRINNVATNGTINFMTGSTSRFKVANNGFIGIGNANPENELHIGAGGNPILKIDGAVNAAGQGGRIRWTESFAGDYGMEAMFDGASDELIFRHLLNSLVDADNILVVKGFPDGRVGVGVAAPLDVFHVAGDIRVGTGTTGCVKDADGTLIAGVCSSDLRLKKNIVPFPSSLDRVSRLQPVHFYWRSDEYPDRHFGNSESFGLVAQDVEKVLPELVTTDDSGYKAVRYNVLPFHLLQAIKDLKSENDDLKARLTALEAAVAAQAKR